MMTGNCDRLPVREFNQRLTTAKPGQIIVYATGFLAADTAEAFHNKTPTAADLSKVAEAALLASVRGEAFLTQRCIGPRRFEFAHRKPNGVTGKAE